MPHHPGGPASHTPPPGHYPRLTSVISYVRRDRVTLVSGADETVRGARAGPGADRLGKALT
ncbi:hypothetical protein GCM10022254_28540 [Actinomadura meridiana]|uniref:Uncharacterized protein n=1 Tax=Actinomadura meridiana TaxID=559626 RepID=A0ABP8C0I2_9ACTN